MEQTEQDRISDAEFLRLALDAQLGRFGHLDHLRLAYAAMKATDGSPEAVTPLCRAAIHRIAAAAGAPDKFHETITIAWVVLLASHVRDAPHRTFQELLVAEPRLRDRDLLLGYYSQERLFSNDARAAWVEPDLAPLPAT